MIEAIILQPDALPDANPSKREIGVFSETPSHYGSPLTGAGVSHRCHYH